jgi:glycosyltransferase involved in cell wall biosynthesis
VPNEKIKIIPAGVDVDKFKPISIEEKELLRKNLGILKESFILLTARNLVPRMGLDNLILAFNILARKKANVKLIIAGGGFLEKRLKLLAKRLNLSDKVIFSGSLSEDILVKYYQVSDLFILPTQFLEGFGIATIEALACGLPVLGTPVGGTIEILGKLDRNTLFSSTEAESMAEEILEFIEDTQDKRLFSKRCRQFILDNYSLVKFFQDTEKLYQSVVQEK